MLKKLLVLLVLPFLLLPFIFGCQKIHLLFASNQAPDVIFINNLYLPVYASKLLDLSDWQNLDDFYPESIKAMSYENKVLAIPRDVSTLVFYRNKALIPQKPQNLEELINSISKSKYFGISCERNVYYMLPYIQKKIYLNFSMKIFFHKHFSTYHKSRKKR